MAAPLSRRLRDYAQRHALGITAAFTLVITLFALARDHIVEPVAAQSSFTFDGGGYGHGVGMSQWGAKGRADAGQSAAQILGAYYAGTQIAARPNANIKVHLADTSSTSVKLAGFTAWTVNGASRATSAPGDTVAIKAVANSLRIQTTAPKAFPEITVAGPGEALVIQLTPGQATYLEETEHRYQYGRMVFRLVDADTFNVTIDSLPMQQYLYGIAEVPASWPVEALKAQAIAARTYAAYRLSNPRAATFDLYSTEADQVYIGVDKEVSAQSDRWNSAVNATDQQVLLHNGQPITAFYFSSSGGATENSEYVFINTLPYARAASDPFDNAAGNPYHRWSRSYSGAELGAWIKTSRSVDLGDVTKLEYSGPFGASGRIDRAQIKVVGTKGSASLSGAQLQGAINANAPANRQLLSSYVFIRPFASYDFAGFAPGGVRVAGWAFYPGSGAQIQVTIDGRAVNNINANGARPDVAAVVPGAPANTGFDAVIPVTDADSTVCLSTVVAGSSNAFPIGCRTVSVPIMPFGSFDVAANAGNAVRVQGWAADPQTPGGVSVHVYVDGVIAGGVEANRTRSDLLAAIPAYGANHGFDGILPAAPGLRQVCAYAINVGPGSNVHLGCKNVEVLPPKAAKPLGYFDAATSVGGNLNVTGWTIDPDTTGPIDVHVYIDGKLAGGASANRDRGDVGAIFPSYGSRHGFDAPFAAAPGLHTACVFAINDGPDDHTLLGCQNVNVVPKDAAAPYGSLDVVRRVNGGIRFEGWAIDPDTNTPISVHLYVGSAGVGVPADRSRTDVDAVFHRGANHGFDWTLAAPAAPVQACAYAINNNGSGPHTLLGCRTL